MSKVAVSLEKRLKILPIRVVDVSRKDRVVSVCRRNFASPCHVANSKRRSRTRVLNGSGRRSSNTGIAHLKTLISMLYKYHYEKTYLQKVLEVPRCEFLHARGVFTEFSDCASAKCGHLAISVDAYQYKQLK